MHGLTAAMPADWSEPADREGKAAEGTSGGQDPVAWVRVATAAGTPNALIIAGRLEYHAIPTRVTQEAAGVSVFPTTVGLLGTAYVWVPEELAEQAQQILSTDWEDEEE